MKAKLNNRKSMTPTSLEKRHILKQRALFSQKESTRATDGKKLGAFK
jgi:hypothetical protein